MQLRLALRSEFRTAFLAGAFNLKVATILSLQTQQQANTTKQLQRSRRCCISWISATVQLLMLMSVDEMKD